MSFNKMSEELKKYTKMYNELTEKDSWLGRLLMARITFLSNAINNLLRDTPTWHRRGGNYNGLRL